MSLPFTLDVERVYQSFHNQHVLKGISFSRSRPGITMLLGENGVGKSVLLRTIAGISLPRHGQIALRVGVHQYNTALHTQAREHIGYQSEYLAYWPDYTVLEMLNFALSIKSLAAQADVEKIIEQFRLEEVVKIPLRRLSFGYQRRLSVAISMIGNPQILLLDEPTNGLDPGETEFFLEHIKKTAQTTCIILASHRLEEVHILKAEILLLKNGRLSYDGPPVNQLKEWYHEQHLDT